MEDNVKKVTGKPAVKKNTGVSETPPEQESVKVKQPAVSEKKTDLPKDLKGKATTINVNTRGEEVKRDIQFDNAIVDFWNHKPTTKKGDGVQLHLVDYRNNYRWFSVRQIEITIRRADEVIVDNRPPTKQDYIAFPKYTEVTVASSGKCKGCS